MEVDPITLEIVSANISGLNDEMMDRLFRTGYSTIVRESRDGSCGILDSQYRTVQSAESLALHCDVLSTAGEFIERFYSHSEMADRDAFLVNHPYQGGSTHATDTIVISPVFYGGEIVAFTGTIEHKPDMGGLVPGTNAGNATEIFHEGLLIPPVKYYRRGEPDRDLENIIRANSRTPDLIIGDLRGQVGVCMVAGRRLGTIFDKYGKAKTLSCFDRLIQLVEDRTRRELSSWPDGLKDGEALLDHDGINFDRPKRIHLSVEKIGGSITFDFSDSDEQAQGPVNTVPGVIRNTCYHGVVAFTDPRMRFNHGIVRAVYTRFRQGTILNPKFPAAVNAYATTAYLVAELVMKVLGSFVPQRAMASDAHAGAHALSVSSNRSGGDYVLYELHTGGQGAREGSDGTSAAHPPITAQATATPIEIIETEFPIRMLRWELRTDSGGPGKFRGGLAEVREYMLLSDGKYSARRMRHTIPAWGLLGGREGGKGRLLVNGKDYPSFVSGLALNAGDIITLEQPGGGGYGDPSERDTELVLQDVLDGYVSLESAAEFYKVVIDPRRIVVDIASTSKKRWLDSR